MVKNRAGWSLARMGRWFWVLGLIGFSLRLAWAQQGSAEPDRRALQLAQARDPQKNPASQPAVGRRDSVGLRGSQLQAARNGGIGHGLRTVDPRSFGAKFDGSHDDSLAIQAAIDSLIDPGAPCGAANLTPGVVFIPSGKARLDSPIWLDVSGVTLQGEGPASRLLQGSVNGIASFPVILGRKRVTNWRQKTPYERLPRLFDPNHRVDLFRRLDETAANGPGLRWGIRSRPAKSPAPPDHFAIFWASPMAHGSNDYWKDTQRFCLQIALENPNNSAFSGSICGIGSSQLNFGTWHLWAADDSAYHFRFQTIEGTRTGYRSFSFGNTKARGIQKIWIQVDLTSDDENGICRIAAAINGVQVPVKRDFGTRLARAEQHLILEATGGTYSILGFNPITNRKVRFDGLEPKGEIAKVQAALDSLFGTGNTRVTGLGNNYTIQFTGALADVTVPPLKIDSTKLSGSNLGTQNFVEPAFTAASRLHFEPNYTLPFALFADPLNHGYSTNKISDLIIYGLSIRSAWAYKDNKPGNPEVRLDNRPNNDFLRYFDTSSDNNHLIGLLSMQDRPHDPQRTSDTLITALHGPHLGLGTFGMFVPDTHFDEFNTVAGVALNDLRLEANGYWGGGALCQNAFACRIRNCHLRGGWHGLSIYGGYDYKCFNLNAFGADAWIFCSTAMCKVDTIERSDVGETAIRLQESNFEASDIKTNNMNAFRHTTESVVRVHTGGSYGCRYKFDYYEGDNENSTGPVTAIFHIGRTAFTWGTFFEAGRIATGNQGGSPVFFFDDGDKPVDSSMGLGVAKIEQVDLSDGYNVNSTGPGWEIMVDHSNPVALDYELVRLSNRAGTGRVEYTVRTDRLPEAGRFVAGTVRLLIWNPEAGGVAEYRCTASGTAAWSSTKIYQRNMYVSRNDTEYKCNADNVRNDPPPSARWITLGPANPPTWKAVSTVSP